MLAMSASHAEMQNVIQSQQPQKAKFAHSAARAEAEHQWESLGTCSWVDDILSGLFSGVAYYTTSSELQQDALNKGYYRIVAPYGTDSEYNSSLSSFLTNNGDDGYILINATDPNNVIIEPSPLGIMYNGEEMTINSYNWYETDGSVSSELIDSYGLRGTLADDIITFTGANGLFVSTPTLETQGYGFFCNASGKFTVYLPGAVDYSVELLTSSWCADDSGRIIVSAWCDESVPTVKAGFVSEPTDEAVAEMTNVVTLTPQQGAYMTIPSGCADHQRLYLAAVTYDANGNPRSIGYNVVYAPDKSTTWVRSTAKATFKEYIVSHIYTDIDLGTYQVAVDEDSSCPGRYRLVNPYADVYYNTLSTGTHGTHDHYLYIDASDPNCVVLEESPIGLVLTNDGDLRVSSRAAMYLYNGYTKDEIKELGYGGVMQDGIVKWPFIAYTYAGFLVEGPDYWMNVNFSESNGSYSAGPMYIDFSAVQAASVASPIADQKQADDSIYDLQGRKVIGNPAPGLYIQCGKKIAITR